MENTCKKCTAQMPSADGGRPVCTKCERLLATCIKLLYTVTIALWVLAGCTAGTAIVFFVMAASRSGNPAPYNYGSRGKWAMATPGQLFAMVGMILLFSIGMYVGSVYSKRGQKTAELEYEEFVGKPFVRGANETVF